MLERVTRRGLDLVANAAAGPQTKVQMEPQARHQVPAAVSREQLHTAMSNKLVGILCFVEFAEELEGDDGVDKYDAAGHHEGQQQLPAMVRDRLEHVLCVQ